MPPGEGRAIPVNCRDNPTPFDERRRLEQHSGAEDEYHKKRIPSLGFNLLHGNFWGGLTPMFRIGVRNFQRTSSNMTDENNIDPNILRIRKLAGKIGSYQNIEKGSDAENYEFQVDVGLAEAVSDIQGYDPQKLIYWFGFCIIRLGANCDERIQALLDALEREINSQFENEEQEAA